MAVITVVDSFVPAEMSVKMSACWLESIVLICGRVWVTGRAVIAYLMVVVSWFCLLVEFSLCVTGLTYAVIRSSAICKGKITRRILKHGVVQSILSRSNRRSKIIDVQVFTHVGANEPLVIAGSSCMSSCIGIEFSTSERV